MKHPIYKFLKENNLTQKSEVDFINEYSNPQKSAELYKFFAENNLTSKSEDDFYQEYFNEEKKNFFLDSSKESTEPQEQPTTPSAKPTPKAPLPSTPNELLYTGALGGLKRNEPIAGTGKPLKQKQEPIDVTYTPEEMPSETTERAMPQGVRQFGQRAKEAEKQISKGQLPTDPQFVNEGTISKVEENRKKLGLSTLDESFESVAKQRKEAEKFDKYEYDSRDINSLEKIFGKSKDEVVYNLENLKFTPEWGPLYEKYTKGLETIVPGWDPESGLGGIASSGLRSKAKDFIYQNYLNDYNILKNDVDSQGIKIKNDISTKISDYFAKNDPSQYMKDAETLSFTRTGPSPLSGAISSVKTGEKVVDMDKVNKLVEEMMSKSGQSTDFGYVRDLIIDAIKTDVNQEIIKPEAEKLLKGERAWTTSQPLKEIITSPSFIYNEAKKEYQEATGKAWDENKQNVDITAKTRLKLDSEYKNIEQSAKSEQDTLLKEYERLVELAKQQGTEAPNPDIINEKIAQINTKYEQRWQRSQNAILEKANIELEAAYKKFTEGLNIDPSIQQKFERAYSLAYSEAAKNRDNRLDVAVADKGLPMTQFARTYMTALGGSLKGYGAAYDNQTLKDFGNALEQNFYLAPAKIDGWNSLLEGEGILGNFQKLNGMLAGSMTTGLAASTLAAVSTGGTGVLPVISASITGFLAESAEMAGRAKQEMFLKTGSISRANKAYEDTWRAQYNIAGLYAFEGLPFIGKAISGIGSKGLRIGLGAGVEYATEVPQEFTQGIYEENIAAGLDPWDSFYEKTNPFGDSEAAKIARKRHEENLITLTPTLIMGGAGQIRSTSEKTDAINAYAAMTAKEDMASQLPDLKSQWLQNLYQSKGGKFTSGVLASMHQAGQITTEQFGELNIELERVKNTIETARENGITKKGDVNLFSFLSRQSKVARQNADKYANSNPGLSKFWEEKAKEYDQQSADFLNGKTPNVFTVTFADGSQSILSEYEAKMMAKSDSFLGALENGSARIESYRNDQKEFMDGLRSLVDSRRQNISNLTQGIVSEVGVSDASKVEKMVMSHPNYNSMTPGQKASLSFKLKELATLVEQAKSEPKAGQEQNIERVKKELADILDYKKTPKSQKETIAQANKFDRELYVLNEKKNKFFSPRISQLMNENKMSRADAAAQAETEWQQTEDGKRELALQEERKKLDAVARGYVLQDPSSVPLEITTSETTEETKKKTELPLDTEAPTSGTILPDMGALLPGANVVEPESIEERRKIVEAEGNPELTGLGEFSVSVGGSNSASVPVGRTMSEGKIETIQYANPQSGNIDLIISSTPSQDYVAYIRIYDKDGNPTNQWTSKMQSREGAGFSDVISEAKKILPEGHEWTEKTSVSTDGLRVFGRGLERGYELQYDENGNVVTNRVMVNVGARSSEEMINAGVPVTNEDKKEMEPAKVGENDEQTKQNVTAILTPYLKKMGLNESNIYFKDGKVYIDLPVLKQSKKVTDDKKDQTGLPSQVGEGQKPIKTQPIQGAGAETTEASGVLQAPEEVTVPAGKVAESLKDVESTAKALEGEITYTGKRGQADSITYNGKTIKQGDEIELNNVNISQDDSMPDMRSGKYKVRMLSVDTNGKSATLTLTDGNELITTTVKDLRKATSEAYHADKAAGKETELTKAVEQLLGKPKEATPTTEAAPEEVTLKNGVKVTPTKISGQTKFFHASPKKREGRLRPNEAPQWGKAIYFATNKKSATDEFGGDNVTEASLNLKNPVYTNAKEFKDVEKKAAELYNREMLPEILKDEAELVNGKWRFFDEDLQAEYDKNGYIDKYSSSDIEEGKYFGQAAKELGYDAIIDEGNQYGSEIAVLDENAVIYPEDIELKESPQATTVSEVVEEGPAPKKSASQRLRERTGRAKAEQTTISAPSATPSVRPARAVEASEKSNPEAGEDSAFEAAGMTREERDEWKKNNKAQGKKPKIEQLTQAVKDLVSGKKSFKDYYKMAKELMPSKLMDKVPTAATFKEIIGAIDSNKLKIGIVGLNKFVKKGMRVGLRIDIPSFNNHGKNVVTVHDRSKSGQEVIGYGSTGSIKNVNFRTSVPTAAKIGTGETSKSAFAMAEGEWMDESPESIQKRAEEAMNSPEWVQVSMNPARNSFFFDKADGNPVVSADEVLQVGNLVLAKNPKKIDLNTAEGMAEFERVFSATDKATGTTYQFSRKDISREGIMDSEEAFNQVADMMDAGLDAGKSPQVVFDEISKTKAYDSLNETDKKEFNAIMEEEGAVTTPKKQAAPKPQTTEETTQAQMEFPEPTERNDENINALLEKKRKYNNLPKKTKLLATNLLNEIRSMAKDMGIEVTFAAGFEIRLTDKKTGKNITKRGVDRAINKDRNQAKQSALKAAFNGDLGMYPRVMLWFRSGGKILTSQSELGNNTREMKDAKRRGYIGDDGDSAEMIAEQLVIDVLGVDPERASEYVYDNDLVTLFQNFLSEYGNSSKEDIENAITDIYLRNAKEQNEEAKGRFEMEYGKGALGLLNQELESESKPQEEPPQPESGQSTEEDNGFSLGGEDAPFRRIKGPTERGEAVSGAEAVKMVENFLKASGINVRVLNDKDFDALLGKKGYSVDADGVFMTNDNTGEVLIRRSGLESKYGDVIVFHEGIHPVINIIRNTDPKLYNAIVQGIKNEAKTNKKIQGIISEVERVMEGEPAPAVEDEIVTEVFARIASGDVKLSEIKKSLAEKIIYYANKIAKLLGLNKRIGINPSDIEFRDFANDLTNALRQGGSITDVVGRGREKDFIKDYAEKLSIQPSRIFYVRSLTNISKFKANKNYQQAKAGDSKSAEKLINETLTKDHEDKIKKITSKYPDAEIVPVRKLKETGTNRIPNALAQKVVEIGGGNLNLDIVQYGESSRKTQGKAQRFFERPDFQGRVEKGKKYILVDDAFATGGTIKSLKDYIEDNGGDVVNVIVLGAGRAGTKFEPTKLDKRILLGIYGERNLNTLLELSGRNSIENLTKDEIDFLKNFESVDRVLAKELAERIKYATDKIYINYEKTKDGRTITTTPEGSFISESGNVQYSRRGIVRGEKDKGGSADTTVKNVWNQYKGIKFNGSLKIEDAYDVAHIMRQLENKAVEHAFAVHVDKNGKPHIQFLGMGGVSSTIVDKTLVLAGAKRYNSKKIYLVHNHPSGSMKPSSHDISLTNEIREAFTGLKIPIEHVILDTYKKEFVHIDISGYPSVESRDQRKEADEKYLQSLKTEMMDEFEVLSAPLAKVTSSRDTAQFFTQMRFTALPKNGMLVMNRQNHVIGNYILPGGFNYKDVTDNMVGAGVGQSVIFYSNQDNYKDIDPIKKGLEAAGISVLDYILVDSNSQSVNDFYKSYADEGLLTETQQEYGTTPVEKQKAQFSRKMDRDMAVTPSGEAVKTKPLPEGLAIINGFYSPIEKNLMEYGKDKIKAKDWLNVVGKGDEAVFTGVRAFLEGKDPNAMVSKQEILDYMKDNRIEIKEVVKGVEDFTDESRWKKRASGDGVWETTASDGTKLTIDASEGEGTIYIYADGNEIGSEEYSPGDDLFDLGVQTIMSSMDYSESPTKFSQYQLEGERENYKEVLVTLPSRVAPVENTNVVITKDFKAPNGSIHYKVLDKSTGEQYKHIGSESSTPESVRYEVLIKFDLAAQQRIGEDFKSTHFDEPNILVHLRMNTRTDADGKKVLFLEEIQSDWGQTGKKEGFVGDKAKELFNQFKYEVIDVNGKKLHTYFSEDGETVISSSEDKNQAKIIAENKARKNADFIYTREVPTAPFVMDTNAWTKLGLKVALKEAVAQGVDKIAWTTGEQQNDRYDLSKQVKQVEWNKYTERGAVKLVTITPITGNPIELPIDENGIVSKNAGTQFDGQRIDNVIGKEIGDKIVSESNGDLSGRGLKVGGKGMKGFYGSMEEGTKGIVGGVAEKLFGQNLKMVDIVQGDKLASGYDVTIKDENGRITTHNFDTKSKGLAWLSEQKNIEIVSEKASGKITSTQPSIDITPEIKAEVLQGQAQFSRKMSRDLSEEERGQSLEGVKTEMARIEDSISDGADPQTAYDELFATQDYADISMDVRMKVNAAIKKMYPNVTTAENIARGLTESYEKKEAKVADVLRNDRDLAYIYRNFPSIIDQLKENKVIEIEGDCV